MLNYPGTVVVFDGFDYTRYERQGILGLDDSAFAKRILCEGDSWFSIGAIPSGNMLQALHFSQSTLLVNMAASGDTIKSMSSIVENPIFSKAISAVKWDAIFVSGGGNDLIKEVAGLIVKPSSGAGDHLMDYIDLVALAKFKNEIINRFIDISKMRDAGIGSEVPLVTHVYDYPTPRNAKARFIGMNKRLPPSYLP